MELPNGARGEVLAGELIMVPSPTPAHQDVVGAVYAELRGPFQRGRGGPGGWWLLPDVDVSFGPHDIVRPDVSGWRKLHVPDFPSQRTVAARPDWVCEGLSPSSTVIDQGSKKALYAKSGVPWYWILDPQNRTVTVLELETGAYQSRALVGDRGTARLAPFDEIEIQLDGLFPPIAG